MHALHDYTGSGSKVIKIAIVSALHLGVALALISMKVHVPPAKTEVIDIYTPATPKPVEPKTEKPDLSVAKTEAPKIRIPPPPEVVKTTEPTVSAEVIRGPVAETEKETLVPGKPEGRGKNPAGDDTPKAERIFSAALANANDCIRPDYPARSARNGDSGTVSLALLIGTDGRVAEAKVWRSSGHKELDRAAVSALSLCKFKPATTNGVAEPAWGQIAYVWSLAE